MPCWSFGSAGIGVISQTSNSGHRLRNYIKNVGQFPIRLRTAEEAISLAKAAKQQALVDEIQGRLELYRAGKPYREQEKTGGRRP